MFAWVILNYMMSDLTISQVDNIQTHVQGVNKIFIVDNASPNGAGQKLSRYYKDSRNVFVIESAKNLGFAKGNNLGYKEALKYSPDFVVFSNNDIQIFQDNFQQRILTNYQETGFALFGPDIFVPDSGIHQNPKKLEAYDPKIVQSQVQKNERIISHPLQLSFRANVKKIDFVRKIIQRNKKQNDDWKKFHDSVVLHGAFIVASKQFMDEFTDWAFYPQTFFYYETEILDLFLRSKHLKAVYNPDIQVRHLQNSSTKASFSDATARLKFQATQMVESGKVFLKVYEELNH